MNLEYLRSIYFAPLKGASATKDSDIEKADRYIWLGYQEVYRSHRWEYRKKTGNITLIPNYTTGTVTVTKYDGTNDAAARTVSFTGASLSEVIRGRYLQVGTSSYQHKIIYLTGSGTTWTAYLDSPVVDVNSGAYSFKIWKRFYYAKSDAEEITDIGTWGNGRLESNQDFIGSYDDITKTASGNPYAFSVYGVDPYDDIESSGTIAISQNSNVAAITGVDLFSLGYDTGDIIKIGNNDYYIKRSETGSRAIMQNYFSEDVAAGTTVAIKKNNPIGFQFYNPSDNYVTLHYEYMDRPYPLVHPSKDSLRLSDRFIPAIISRAQYHALKDADDSRYLNALNVYDGELEGLKSKSSIVKPRYSVFAPKITSSMPGRG